MRARLTKRADAELAALYRWGVEHFGRAVADEYYDGLVSLCALLAERPGIARRVKDATHAYPYRSHILIFREATGGIDVLHIRHGMSNWKKYL